MVAYATAAQLLTYKDAATIGELVGSDGNSVASDALLDSTTEGGARVAAVLKRASGEIEAAVLIGNRYTTTDLSSLPANSAEYLVGVTCDLAMKFLFARKPTYAVEEYKAYQELADLHLERLRKGERIFDVAAVEDAGTPDVITATLSQINDLGLIRDQVRNYYPARRVQETLS